MEQMTFLGNWIVFGIFTVGSAVIMYLAYNQGYSAGAVANEEEHIRKEEKK